MWRQGNMVEKVQEINLTEYRKSRNKDNENLLAIYNKFAKEDSLYRYRPGLYAPSSEIGLYKERGFDHKFWLRVEHDDPMVRESRTKKLREMFDTGSFKTFVRIEEPIAAIKLSHR